MKNPSLMHLSAAEGSTYSVCSRFGTESIDSSEFGAYIGFFPLLYCR